ncbi:MAG: hypothetical protein CL897_04335 [Dehalococcoidia bacterium]|nr:hypothetical protein [Dehalococcoidia bacterium]|tara:strand:+ start:284 stop:529 length:246 start_codon:yes stop_codon:yes gene_type:complete
MAKRWRPPFNFKRYCGDKQRMVIHDLVCEKPDCSVSTLEDAQITMWDSEEEIATALAGGEWKRHEPCESGALYFTPREDLK